MLPQTTAIKHTHLGIEYALRLRTANSAISDGTLPKVRLVESAGFWATIKGHYETCELRISTGLINQVIGLQNFAKYDFGASTPGTIDQKAERKYHLSLAWLILHELGHLDLGHLKLIESFGISARVSEYPDQFKSLPLKLRRLAPRCLELQADHMATNLMLGKYYTDGWVDLRENVLAISGMMMLIELEDSKNDVEGKTHPKAATRIFQLLGHLAEMPLIKAQLNQDASLIPHEDELQAFARDVTTPCLFDAIQLAQSAGAAFIASDLGSPEYFFKDVEIAKLGDPSRYSELNTQGAREWAKLWSCNEALKPILGGHFET